MVRPSQEVSSSLLAIDTKVRDCYETQVRTFSRCDDRLIEQLVHDHHVGCILDVGCGEDSFILHVAKLFPQLQIRAVETIHSLIAECKRKQDQEQILNVVFENAMFNEEFPASDCDAITARFAVEHMRNVPLFLDCAHQYLRPGGMIAITEYCVMNVGISDPVWLEYRNRELELYHRIQSHPQISFQLPCLLQRSGFQKITSAFHQISPSTVNKVDFYDLVTVYADLYNRLDPSVWTREFVSRIHDWAGKECQKASADATMWLTQTVAEK